MIQFEEGHCCGDCAKCMVVNRPRTTQGVAVCATANMLPKLFCVHDLLIEQNAILARLLKEKDADLADLRDFIREEVQSLGKREKVKEKPKEVPKEIDLLTDVETVASKTKIK